MPKTYVRQGQVWQAKNYAQHNDRTIIVREVNGDIVWVELRDGQKTATTRQNLTQDFLPLTHH